MKKDEISKFYCNSNRLHICKNACFYLNLFCAILNFINGNNCLIIFQVLLAFLFVTFDTVDDGIFWFQAEKLRRRNSIENAFDIDLSEYKTTGYYNNRFSPSIKRMASNIFESNFFSYCIAREMLVKSSLHAVCAVCVFIASCISLSSELLLIITEAVFSSFVFYDTIFLVIYFFRMKALYDDAYSQFISIGISKKEQFLWILAYALEYESIKAYYKVRLDEKIFMAKNKMISKKWDSIQQNIRFS